MENKNKLGEKFPKGFFKQFKSNENFQEFFNSLFKQGIEEMLQGKLDEHLGYTKHIKECYNEHSNQFT